MSRTAPVFSYSNSGPRDVQVQLHLHRDILDGINVDGSNFELEEGEDFVDALIRKLQAIALPAYRVSNKAVVPPMIAVKFGNEIFIKGVVNGGVSIEYQKPILDNDKYANVTLNFTVYEVEPYDAESVGIEGSFRGITQTFKETKQRHSNIFSALSALRIMPTAVSGNGAFNILRPYKKIQRT